jgi:hypothetical protein
MEIKQEIDNLFSPDKSFKEQIFGTMDFLVKNSTKHKQQNELKTLKDMIAPEWKESFVYTIDLKKELIKHIKQIRLLDIDGSKECIPEFLMYFLNINEEDLK